MIFQSITEHKPNVNWDESVIPSDEPDAAVWVDEATGLRCAANRNFAGAWCGYVQVPHSMYDADLSKLVVHGGITYDGSKHKVLSNRAVGFDCSHCRDLVPYKAVGYSKDTIYRTFEYVIEQIQKLAKQIKKLEGIE